MIPNDYRFMHKEPRPMDLRFRMTTLLLLGAGALIGWSGWAAQDAGAQKDLAAMKGDWKVIRADRNGHAASEELLKQMSVNITDDTITVNDGQRKFPAKFKLNPSTQPKQIDLSPAESSDVKILGIYEIKDGVLKLCYLRGEGERPKEFKSTEQSRLVLMELKRP